MCSIRDWETWLPKPKAFKSDVFTTDYVIIVLLLWLIDVNFPYPLYFSFALRKARKRRKDLFPQSLRSLVCCMVRLWDVTIMACPLYPLISHPIPPLFTLSYTSIFCLSLIIHFYLLLVSRSHGRNKVCIHTVLPKLH